MSDALAHTLVNQHLLEAKQVQEAVKRQVVQGGSLDTNLLEAGVGELVLLRGLSEAHNMPPVGKDEIDIIPQHIPRLFPLLFAETYHLVPYRLVGSNLGVLINGPSDEQLLARIGERLQLQIKSAVTTEVRLHYAMHRLYGIALLPRFNELLVKMDGALTPNDTSDAPILAWGVASGRTARKSERRPIVIADEVARLVAATDRDSIVDILLDVTLSTFNFAAIFLVQGERINGWRSGDPEATRRIARISLPIELPSVFQTIYATHGHYLGPLPTNSVNTKLCEDMGRQPPRTALLAPILVGGKLAAILYADNGGRGVSSQRVSAILLLAHRGGMALETLIRQRRSATARLLVEGAPPTAEQAPPPAVSEETPGFAPIAVPMAVPPPVEPRPEPAIWSAPADDIPLVDEDHYVAFADLDESPEGAVSGWEDVLVETVGGDLPDQATARTRPSEPEAAAPAVTWDDVIAEAMAAPQLVAAPPSAPLEVAGTKVDERELLFDSLAAADPEIWKPAIEKLLPLGTAIDEELAGRFPGDIRFDPFAQQVSLPPFALCSGITAILFSRGPAGAPLVLQQLESNDRLRRFFAIYFLYAVPYPPGLELLARRLYDAEPRNRYLAADTLRNYRHLPGYRRILQGLRDHLKVPVFEAQVATVQVLGQLRDPSAVPSLIPLVVSPRQALARAASSALNVICAQAFGTDVTRWAEWWQSHFNKPREAWLIEGMRHADNEIRRIAAREFQLLTGQVLPGNEDDQASRLPA